MRPPSLASPLLSLSQCPCECVCSIACVERTALGTVPGIIVISSCDYFVCVASEDARKSATCETYAVRSRYTRIGSLSTAGQRDSLEQRMVAMADDQARQFSLL
jgi:hypothetical protein